VLGDNHIFTSCFVYIFGEAMRAQSFLIEG